MPYYHAKTKAHIKSVLPQLENRIYETIAPLNVRAWVTPEPVPFAQRHSGREMALSIGDKWGDLFDCAWFHFTGQVPESARGKQVVLLIDINGEACVVDADGNPVLGLTTVNSLYSFHLGKPGKRVVPVSDAASGGEVIDLWADAGCNDLFGRLQGNGTLKEAHIAVCRPQVRELFYDWAVLLDLLEQLPETQARHRSIQFALAEAANLLRTYSDEEVAAAREILGRELAKRGGDPSLSVSAIGHAHIDLGWLWPIRETIRKGARTFATALYMMDRYPDYIFGASQPQLYEWIKEHYPRLYERIKASVAAGRWEPQGAMWVEADTNVSGGEALVRQILYGKRFFRAEFGHDMEVLWLPDVFGYSAALPQLLSLSGVKYFMTIKLSWSQHNQIPHHTFIWEGIDGSRVLAHMPPEGNYNSSAAPRAFAASERNYLDKGLSDRCLVLFGIGDGGGGPGEEHLENLRRVKNLAGIAPVEQEWSLAFFRRLEQNAARYHTWTGELYLERHQGTYTTQARNKRYNRKIELALRDLEFAAVLAAQQASSAYPAAQLERIWKEVLLYQFHDILPGSSITRVYTESLARYAALMQQVEELTKDAWAAVTAGQPPASQPTASATGQVLVANTLSWDREEWVQIGDNWQLVKAPALGYIAVDATAKTEPPRDLVAGSGRLENDVLQVQFGADGSLVSVFDKELQREVLEPGARGNRLAVYRDTGDAWDIPIDYAEMAPDYFALQDVTYEVSGPRAIATQTYTFGNSRLVQQVVLTAGSRRIDFVTHVDWREKGKMLRTSFPVQVMAREAACEIQFGHVKRPTHDNTSWDMARFEVCAHRWVDMSQGDYGVALLNDCKYGHRLSGNVLDLNLLRSPSYPDPEADQAEHDFTYSLYPHRGDLAAGRVVQTGYELNVPLRLVPLAAGQPALAAAHSFLRVGAANVVVEAVKKAEDSDAYVIRLYECHGASATAHLEFGFPVKRVQLVNLMEEEVDQAPLDAQNLNLTFGPFQIHTLLVTPA